MNHEIVASYCESMFAAEATAPFGPNTIVYKVGGKMFALLSLETPRLNVKCEPETAVMLRERYNGVIPGYHMNKKHWNSLLWEEGDFSAAELQAWIKESYDLVFESLSKAAKAQLDEKL